MGDIFFKTFFELSNRYHSTYRKKTLKNAQFMAKDSEKNNFLFFYFYGYDGIESLITAINIFQK